MNEQLLRYYFSNPRLHIYLAKTNSDFDKAIKLYLANIELSEAFYPVLSLLEISLRNAIHETLKVLFQDEYWFENKLPNEFKVYVLEAIQKLTAQHKTITADRIISELNFGNRYAWFLKTRLNKYGNEIQLPTVFTVFENYATESIITNRFLITFRM